MTQLWRLLAIEKTRTTQYHPQSDGLVEIDIQQNSLEYAGHVFG